MLTLDPNKKWHLIGRYMYVWGNDENWHPVVEE